MRLFLILCLICLPAMAEITYEKVDSETVKTTTTSTVVIVEEKTLIQLDIDLARLYSKKVSATKKLNDINDLITAKELEISEAKKLGISAINVDKLINVADIVR